MDRDQEVKEQRGKSRKQSVYVITPDGRFSAQHKHEIKKNKKKPKFKMAMKSGV